MFPMLPPKARRLGALLSVTVATLVCAPLAGAQQTPAPTPTRIIPPINFSLPPGEQSTPQPTPTPSAVAPPPVIVPTPTPTPTRRAKPPAPAATPATEPAPAATATPSPEPTPLATPGPDAAAPPPAVVPAPAPTPTPTSVDAVEPPEGFAWWWALAAGALVALIAGIVWMRHRAAAREPEPAPEPIYVEPDPVPAENAVPEPPAAPAVPPAPPPAEPPRFLSPVPASDGTIKAFQRPPAPPAGTGLVTAFRDSAAPAPSLTITLDPLRAGTTGEAGMVEFAFVVANYGDVAVGETLVSAWMLSANAAQDTQIREYLAEPADPSKHNLFRLAPGEQRELKAAMGLPFDMLTIVEANGRRFFAPMLLIDARYRTRTGAEGRTSAAFVIGKPQPNGKLAPVFVDRGPRVVDGLEARAYPIPILH